MNTQVEEMVGAWTSLQRQFWDSCMQSQSKGKNKGKQSEWENACKRPLELTRDMLSESLKAQAKLTRDSMRFADPKLIDSNKIDEFFDAMQDMVNSGIDSEEEILESWLSFAKEFEQQLPSSSLYQWNTMPFMNPAMSWSQSFGSVMKAWENAAEKTLEVQNEFVSHLAPEKKNSAKKTTSSANKSSDQGSHKAAA